MANTHSHHKQLEKQLKDIKEALLQSADLPFSNLLSSDTLKEILEDKVSDYRDRVYSPLITLRASILQALSEDHSCNKAVTRIIAERVEHGEEPCSANNGAYCRARRLC